MRNLLFIAALCCMAFDMAVAQDKRELPCAAAEYGQFDFWVGDWNLSWGDDGQGQNHISKVLGDCVVLEEFDGHPSTALVGKSMSTYDKDSGQWRQTWVDNNGAYLDFVGGVEGDTMVLSRLATRAGETFLQRMVFYDIKENSFEWNWERSDDGGASWQVSWHIRYERKK